jgi:branched-chain amino acid transport system substrate-binding protein
MRAQRTNAFLRGNWGKSLAVGTTIVVLAGCGSKSSSTSSATAAGSGTNTAGTTSTAKTPGSSKGPGVTSTTIKLGLLASITGFAAPSFGPDVVTGATAAIKQINAEGGINGRKVSLVVADDASSATQDLTAVQSLISKGVFGIIEASPFFYGGYQTAVTAGIPVTGSANDGPEWGSAKNYNLFSAFGSPNSNYPTFTATGKFFKSFGVTRLAGVAYGDSPSSLGGTASGLASAKAVGIPDVYKDVSQNVGETNFAPDAIAMKKAGVNGLDAVMGTSDNIALLQALKRQGVVLKASFIADGYQQAVVSSPSSVAAAQGVMFASRFAPTELKTPATKAFQSALARYGNYTAPNPTQGLAYGWFAAQTMIKGLQVAGQSPTWGSFITNLHRVTNYTAGGMMAPINYSGYGTYDSLTAGNCFYQSKVEGSSFVPVSPKPFCGTIVSGTSS